MSAPLLRSTPTGIDLTKTIWPDRVVNPEFAELAGVTDTYNSSTAFQHYEIAIKEPTRISNWEAFLAGDEAIEVTELD